MNENTHHYGMKGVGKVKMKHKGNGPKQYIEGKRKRKAMLNGQAIPQIANFLLDASFALLLCAACTKQH